MYIYICVCEGILFGSVSTILLLLDNEAIFFSVVFSLFDFKASHRQY
jgi:hypothetical protein